MKLPGQTLSYGAIATAFYWYAVRRLERTCQAELERIAEQTRGHAERMRKYDDLEREHDENMARLRQSPQRVLPDGRVVSYEEYLDYLEREYAADDPADPPAAAAPPPA